MSDDLDGRSASYITIALFAIIGALIGWDVLGDYQQGSSLRHIAIELLVLAATVAGIVLLWVQLRRTRTDLAHARVAEEQWRNESRELLQGLGVAIEKQFGRWELTKAEAEVGLLLLKGLSHKEIATVRNTSERTIREQSRAVYRKAGLPGRSALSAFFLEDLLLP